MSTTKDADLEQFQPSSDSTPSYIQTSSNTTDNLNEMVSDLVEIEQEAQKTADQDINNLDRETLRTELKIAANREVSKKREVFRATVYQNLTQQNPEWDENIDSREVKNNIDALIDRSIDIWVNRHLEEFINAVNEHTDDSLDGKRIIKYGIGIDVVRRVISRIAYDAIDKASDFIGKDAVMWFLDNTPLNSQELQDAVVSFLRALIGA